jgi:hypothetical protein
VSEFSATAMALRFQFTWDIQNGLAPTMRTAHGFSGPLDFELNFSGALFAKANLCLLGIHSFSDATEIVAVLRRESFLLAGPLLPMKRLVIKGVVLVWGFPLPSDELYPIIPLVARDGEIIIVTLPPIIQCEWGHIWWN